MFVPIAVFIEKYNPFFFDFSAYIDTCTNWYISSVGGTIYEEKGLKMLNGPYTGHIDISGTSSMVARA